MDDFVEILKDLVEEAGLSLRQLARDSGVSVMQLSRYLNGSTPTIDVTLKLATYFNCSLDYLFGISHEKEENKYKSGEYDISKFLGNYQKLLKANNLTNYKFIRDGYFDESVIRHWKAGSKPRLNVVYFIAKSLGGSMDELIGREITR